MSTFYLVNVVWYDGANAFVSKFILECLDYSTVMPDAITRVEKYLTGNGEVLKLDILYSVSFDNILAMEKSLDIEMQSAYDRFKNMYFTN